jgi:mRNA-degrading endonuclease toxin of MazEF toxin-antitoxin module
MAQSVVKRGSVVLIRYPFTDLTGAKVRPALVLTPDTCSQRISCWNLGIRRFRKRG